MTNKESFDFYPLDWINDEKLHQCKLATKGAWIDLICYMHTSDVYGHLIINKKILKEDDIQRLLKITNKAHFDLIWNELKGFDIVKKDKNGSFYSSRLIKEYNKQNNKDVKKGVFYKSFIEIIEHLESVSGKNFSEDKKNFDLYSSIEEKLKDSFSVDDFKLVNSFKTEQWKDNSTMNGYIRPYTLYKDKFKGYLETAREIMHQKKPVLKEKYEGVPIQTYTYKGK